MNSLNIRNIMWIAGLLFVGACSGGKDPLESDSDSVVRTYIFPEDFMNDLVGMFFLLGRDFEILVGSGAG